MNMRVFALPDDIPADAEAKKGDPFFHPYSGPIGSFSGRSVLNRNAISLVIAGEKTIHFAEKRVEIRPDEFHLLSTGNCLVSMEVSGKARFRSILIFFGHETLAAFLRKYKAKDAVIRNGPGVPNRPYLAFKKDAFILGFIASLDVLLSPGKTFSPDMRRLKFEELMLYLLETHPRELLAFQALKSGTPDDAAIRTAVESNLAHPIGLEELAYLCNLSLSTFKRRFAKLYGMPPNQWILRRRMEIARDMLAGGSEKPSEIYHRVGYLNHSSFTEAFKRAYGITPSRFRSRGLDARP
ncbi:MAG TPA: AraC family transcriptional regulator [Fibrobacteria bacterium]|nr:AraC family transcriptional regulator [Fibrobacteria bacterium]